MRKLLLFTSVCFLSVALHAQNIIQAGAGSYASEVAPASAYEDGYFAHPAAWFQLAWDELNLHENARNKPVPTNDWWTDFLFRGLGRTQPEIHNPPVTVTTNGNHFGTEAWAYPHMVTASANGFDVFFPKGFAGNNGSMNKGAALKINATSQVQANDENILFEDFENINVWADLVAKGWRMPVKTAAANTGPAVNNNHNQGPAPSGYGGSRYVNSFIGGDGAQLTLISPEFTISKNYIKVTVGGGNLPDGAYVGLFINGQRVLSETGGNNQMTQRTWNVQQYKGQKAEIRIVDSTGAGWGFVMCDDIIFTDSQLGGAGYTADFQTTAAKVYDWSDTGFTLRSEQAGGKAMNATIIHGVPFVYAELTGLYPIITPGGNAAVYNKSGQQVTTFPATNLEAFTVEYGDRIYGIHTPAGSKVHRSRGGDFLIETPNDKRYVVVSVLPSRDLLGTYDQYARNKPGDIRFIPEYRVEQGKIATTFQMNTKNLDTNAAGGQTLMSFLPHQWRNTTKNFTFIAGAEYQNLKGRMQTGASASFEILYDFGGMPPYLPEPITLSAARRNQMEDLLVRYIGGNLNLDGNTYAKGLGEKTSAILMAKAMDLPVYEQAKTQMISQFANWLSFSEAEKTMGSGQVRYFALYPNYGALIGFPPGYGSQGFNDLHFHNGYFTVGAARLMLIDPQFKQDYGEMVKLVTKTFANWDRATSADVGTANYNPYLRTFDPYLGHSFAGGTGDGGGNNQESTSEAINSWFGVYMLGVALNDKKIIDVGAMGYHLECLATAEYWLDVYEENFPSTYPYEYVGILRTDNYARATYFHGDPAWALGIQACPTDFYFHGFSVNPEKMAQIQQAMWDDRAPGGGANLGDNVYVGDPFGDIAALGGYLGGYHMNILQYTDPEMAADYMERLMRDEPNWRDNGYDLQNKSSLYFNSNAMECYGSPAKGYHTSIPSGAVYENADGTLTYLLYNATDNLVNVNIYKDGQVIATIPVGPGKYYNSRAVNTPPTVRFATLKTGGKLVNGRKTTVDISASDKDGRVAKVELYCDGTLVATSTSSPFGVAFTPTGTGTKKLKAIAYDDDNLTGETEEITVTMIGEPMPFGRTTPWQVPTDRIMAVQFDDGGPEISCHDSDLVGNGTGETYRPGTGVDTEATGNIATSNIGWLQAGEWLEYTINVAKTAVYEVHFANQGAGGGNRGTIRVLIDGEDKTGSVAFDVAANSGYADVKLAEMTLLQGKQTVRVMIEQNGFNFRSFRFAEKIGAVVPPTVDAGATQSLDFVEGETNSVTLEATATTYNGATISTWAWTQVSPANPKATITPNNTAKPVVTFSAPGEYTFEVEVTANNGGKATGQVVVLVKGAQPQLPTVVNAGADQTIRGASATTLRAVPTVSSGITVTKYEWTQVSPANPKATIRMQQKQSFPD